MASSESESKVEPSQNIYCSKSSRGNIFEECLFYDLEVIMLSFGKLLKMNKEEAHFIKFNSIYLSASRSLHMIATFFFSVYLQHLVPCQTCGTGQNLQAELLRFMTRSCFKHQIMLASKNFE